MENSGKFRYYKSFLNEWLVVDDTSLSGIWYSDDGVTFCALFVSGRGNSKCTVTNHQEGWKGKIEFVEDTLVLSINSDYFNKPVFRPVSEVPQVKTFCSLPDVYDLQSLYILREDTYIAFLVNRYYRDFMKSRVYIGPLSALLQTTITGEANAKVKTLLGDLDLIRGTWEGYHLVKMDEKMYSFEMDEQEKLLRLSQIKGEMK